MTAAANLSEATRFLDLMTEGEPVTFQTFGDSAQEPALARVMHGTFGQHATTLHELNARGAGVFWMVNVGDSQGRKAENVTGVRALFVDLDGAPIGPVHDAGLEPDAVVESSPDRWHAYWLVDGCAPSRFKPAQQALAAKFGGDRSVCDLPRVMRLPSFFHQKGQPFTTQAISLSAIQPYSFDALVQAFGLDLKEPGQPLLQKTTEDV